MLESTAYPHIWVNVIASLAPRDALVLRAASRHLYDLVNAHISRHMILYQKGGHGYLVSRDGSVTLRMKPEHKAYNIRMLQKTRILDIQHFSCHFFMSLPCQLPLLNIVRAPRWSVAPPTHTVISTGGAVLFSTSELPRLVCYCSPGFHRDPVVHLSEDQGGRVTNVMDMVIICDPRPMSPFTHSLSNPSDFSRLTVKRATVVGLGDKDEFQPQIGGVNGLESVEWRYMTREEYARTLSDEEKDIILPRGELNDSVL